MRSREPLFPAEVKTYIFLMGSSMMVISIVMLKVIS